MWREWETGGRWDGKGEGQGLGKREGEGGTKEKGKGGKEGEGEKPEHSKLGGCAPVKEGKCYYQSIPD